MFIFSEENINRIIEEVNGEAEKARRAMHERRHKIYLDGGKEYLLEQIEREFSREAVKEMRIAPVNLLKKIIKKKCTIYKESPFRNTELDSDQNLIDYYVEKMSLNEQMLKFDCYRELFSNTVNYIHPIPGGDLISRVTPPYLYTLTGSPVDPTKVTSISFNSFDESGLITPLQDVPGGGNFSRQTQLETKEGIVDSLEKDIDDGDRVFISWSESQHITFNEKGEILVQDESGDFSNPIDRMPIVLGRKETDVSVWAEQGEDLVDLAMAAQLALSDILTIAKHQGFSILNIISEEEPKNLTFGLNRAIWLKQTQDGPQPSIGYVQASSPISEYKDLVLDIIGLMLSTNDMSVNTIGGRAQTRNVTSGFQALIEMSDTLEAVELKKPMLKKAEKEMWDIISRWHNYLFDINELSEEARSYGKFSDDFNIEINYSDAKPIESEQERLESVQKLTDLGLITRRDALKKMNPNLTEDQIDVKMEEIEAEKAERMGMMRSVFQPKDQGSEEDGQEEGQV